VSQAATAAAKPEPQYKKLTRKIKKRPVRPVSGDSGDETDVSDVEVVSRSFKRRVGQKNGGGGEAAFKSNRARERVKYEEERESHSSDMRSDLDEADLAAARKAAQEEEDVDTIDFVLDHRMGESSLLYIPVNFNLLYFPTH
jgi:hypothetical protein